MPFCWLDMLCEQETRREIGNEKAGAESTPIQSRVATGVWNVWRHREAGGFISAGARSVGTSVAVTVLRASMRPDMQQRQGIPSLPASNRVKIGSTITRSGAMIEGVELLPPQSPSPEFNQPFRPGRKSPSRLGIAVALVGVDPFFIIGAGR